MNVREFLGRVKNAVRQKPAREQGRIIALQPSTPLLTRGLLLSSIFFDT